LIQRGIKKLQNIFGKKKHALLRSQIKYLSIENSRLYCEYSRLSNELLHAVTREKYVQGICDKQEAVYMLLEDLYEREIHEKGLLPRDPSVRKLQANWATEPLLSADHPIFQGTDISPDFKRQQMSLQKRSAIMRAYYRDHGDYGRQEFYCKMYMGLESCRHCADGGQELESCQDCAGLEESDIDHQRVKEHERDSAACFTCESLKGFGGLGGHCFFHASSRRKKLHT
jgi:hypothetical protein